MLHIPHCPYHIKHTHTKKKHLKTSQNICLLLYNSNMNSADSLRRPKVENLWPGALFSLPPTTSASLPLLTPCNKPHWSYYTSSSSFLLLPVILPPSLRSHSLHSLHWKKVPPGFLALKGQKQTGSWQPSNSLGSGYRRREEGGQDRGREAGKKVESQERKERKSQGKVLCETFLKPALTTAPAEDGLRYVHLSEETR